MKDFCSTELINRINSLSSSLESAKADGAKISEQVVNLLRSIEQKKQDEKNVFSQWVENNVPTGDLKKFLTSVIQEKFNFSQKTQDLWRQQPLSKHDRQIYPFVSIAERNTINSRTRFISLLNLKGGTGKTTLTANLAAAFASGNYRVESKDADTRPLRVLVVDLDYQGSLSERCAMNTEELKPNYQKTSARLLYLPPNIEIDKKNVIDKIVIPFVGTNNAKLIPTYEILDFFDNKSFSIQVFNLNETRFIYRYWLHHNEVLTNYDLVFFDCPPRETASSINALTCSDYVFIPSSPDSINTFSTDRTISWLTGLIFDLDLSLKIGGIILNRTSKEGNLSNIELKHKKNIERSITNFFSANKKAPKRYTSKNPIPKILSTHIPRRTGNNSIIGEQGQPLPGSKPGEVFFTNLATEIYQRIYE